ncbi:hypothetical protein SAMN05216466_11547 [Paraburkholderia phenazinium]|uniref:Uncharacterized protein n=1 Tax=Paraburkholderia phenazinium TaxID=60549 RepID=A0A1G8GKE2_9BURK|nr:DNA-binding protein [Paraburkholderia phenazinium]SDH94864.1 hypothetical protein SAMN05216466_11547 [Paraburkholderia phenazinium]
MAHEHSETYRGFRIRVEGISEDDHSVQIRRTLARQLGERYAARYEHEARGVHPANAVESAFADAIRDARETVDRLLGGWHPAYA